MSANTRGPIFTNRTIRLVGVLLLLFALIWNAGRAGVSSLLTTYAAITNQIGAANGAVTTDVNNPDAHYIRGTLLEPTDLSAAAEEYYQACLVRPDDYVLWLSLARVRELNGETDSAIAAAREAVPLAPAYAEPHYQLGNILFRAGRREEAFKELRLAGISNPTLIKGMVDLAWRASNGDINYVRQALEPATPELYQATAEYFRERSEIDPAVSMYLAAGKSAIQDRRSYVGELVATKHFKEAAILWGADNSAIAKPGVIVDGGFEQESSLHDPGFGWRIGEKENGFHLSLDGSSPRQGRSSLKVAFDGDSDPLSPIISQLVLVEPSAHEQLSFSVRTEGLVSGGLPFIVVIDVNAQKIIGQSDSLPAASNGWHEYTVDFPTGDSTTAIQIALRRQTCDRSPCPIFGRLWLDDFSLRRL